MHEYPVAAHQERVGAAGLEGAKRDSISERGTRRQIDAVLMRGALGASQIRAFHHLVRGDMSAAPRFGCVVHLLYDADRRIVGEGQHGWVVGQLRGGCVEDFNECVA